jgi:hypothetical protein
LVGSGTIRERVAQAVDAYLGAIEEHPNVFLLLVGTAAREGPTRSRTARRRSPRSSRG